MPGILNGIADEVLAQTKTERIALRVPVATVRHVQLQDHLSGGPVMV